MIELALILLSCLHQKWVDNKPWCQTVNCYATRPAFHKNRMICNTKFLQNWRNLIQFSNSPGLCQSPRLPYDAVKSVRTFNPRLDCVLELTQLFLFWSFSNTVVIPTVNKNICNQICVDTKHTQTYTFIKIFLKLINPPASRLTSHTK